MHMKFATYMHRVVFLNRHIFSNQNRLASSFTVPSYTSSKLNTTAIKTNEKDYVRSVLSKCSECILYESTKKMDVCSLIGLTVMRNALPKSILDDESIRKLRNLARKGIIPDPNAVSQLEQQCSKEYKSWTTEKQLFVLELWYYVPESININFIWLARDELLRRFDSLSQDHTLQTLYYLTWLHRRMPYNHKKMIQDRFMKEINSMPLDHMSIWCMAMSRNLAYITSNKLLEDIYSKLLRNDLQKFNDIGLCAVLKMLRYSSTAHQAHLIIKLLEKLLWHAEHSDFLLISQIAFVGMGLKIYNPKLLESIVSRMSEHVDKIRFKDLERICFVISMFDFKSNNAMNLLRKICQHLLTVDKLWYLDNIIRCIDYMLRCGIYDKRLISWALDPNIISKAYSKNPNRVHSELLSIDMFTEINLANEYSGNRLNDRDCAATVCRRIEISKSKDWTHVTKIANVLKASGRHCIVARTLPHYTVPDVLLIIDTATNKTMDFTQKIRMDGKLIRAADLSNGSPQSKAIAFVMATGTHYLFGMKEYTGYFKLKLKQLAILGYDVIVIPSKEWTYLTGSQQKKYLDKMLIKYVL